MEGSEFAIVALGFITYLFGSLMWSSAILGKSSKVLDKYSLGRKLFQKDLVQELI
jgi:hypothetical protein